MIDILLGVKPSFEDLGMALMESSVLKILRRNLSEVAHQYFQGRVGLSQPARRDAASGPPYNLTLT